MKIKKLEEYRTGENTYIVYDENTKTGIVIDPGYKAEGIMKSAADDGIKIEYIFLTHCHYDHIASLPELRRNTGAKLVTGTKGAVNVGNPDINLSFYGLGFKIEESEPEIILNDGETIEIDGMKIKCIATPGHTNCSVCYLFNEDTLFSGDTLFIRNVGRWDLPTGNEDELVSSIKKKLYALPDDTRVFPGHGEDTSIGYEKKFNMYVTED